MRVRCTKIPALMDGRFLETSPWLHIGGEYTVIGIEIAERSSLHLVADRPQGLAWFDASCFVTIDSSIPAKWRILLHDSGTLDLQPEAWLADGFWESYYDDEPDAVASVASELRMLHDEDDPGSRPVN